MRDDLWLAGLFEGEGCISVQGRTPTLTIAMRDRDVIDRVAALWNVTPSVQRRSRTQYGPSDLWRVRLHGEAALPWIEMLFPHLGERRQQRIWDVICRRAA